MNLAKKQVFYRKPAVIRDAINEGIRAMAERYSGSIQAAHDHCLERVANLTEAKLTRSRASNPPRSTRDGASLITLLWVLLVDGMLPHRPATVTHEWLVNAIEATDLFTGKLTDDDLPQLIAIFTESMSYQPDPKSPTPQEISKTLSQVWTMSTPVADIGIRQIPRLDRLFVGRNDDILELKQRIGVSEGSQRHPLTIVRGWPGVGKTALINQLTHDEQVRDGFAEGVLWSALGKNGNITTTLKDWAREIGARHLLQLQDLSALQNGLRAALYGRDILIIADDIWNEEQGNIIKNAVDSRANTLLMTTRFTEIANGLRDLPTDVYVLEVLSKAHSINLLEQIAPDPVSQHRSRVADLAKAVEYLPLALRVAGPLLQYYYDMNYNVEKLIDEFEKDYNRLLGSKAPADRLDEKTGQTPTIELLFQRSVETLPKPAQVAFAGLGVFQYKPATFDFKALEEVWFMKESTQMLIDMIVGRGLMDTTSDHRYRIHQTLHMYANKLLDDYDGDDLF